MLREYRLTLDISVHLFIRVQVVQTHEKFFHDNRDVLFGHCARFDEVRTTTTSAILHDDPQVRAIQI